MQELARPVRIDSAIKTNIMENKEQKITRLLSKTFENGKLKSETMDRFKTKESAMSVLLGIKELDQKNASNSATWKYCCGKLSSWSFEDGDFSREITCWEDEL